MKFNDLQVHNRFDLHVHLHGDINDFSVITPFDNINQIIQYVSRQSFDGDVRFSVRKIISNSATSDMVTISDLVEG